MPGNRRSIRLKNYDHTEQGSYYVTVCVGEHACRGGSRAALKINQKVFGHAKNGKMILNNIGEIIHNSWLWLSDQYDHVDLDEFIGMPNHIHGIILLTGNNVKGASRGDPTSRKPLGKLSGAFKTVSTKRINANRKTPGTRLWQRNFYEHVIRDEPGLARIREYIINNPANWEMDEYFKCERQISVSFQRRDTA